MASILRVFIAISMVMGCQFAAGQDSGAPSIVINNQLISLKPAVDYYSQFVHVIEKPIYLWSWLSQSEAMRFGNPALDSEAARAFMHQAADGYWQDLCSHDPKLDPPDCDPTFEIDNKYNFGHGLYLARDPVMTVSYGKGNGWHVLQLQLPKGFRYFDLRLDAIQKDLPIEIDQLLRKVGCEASNLQRNSFELIGLMAYSNPYFGTNPVCNLALRKVFKEALKIEGFFYPYLATSFATCTTKTTDGTANGEAFVLADDSRITQFTIFNAESTKQKEDRIRIQSFFYKASHEDFHTNFDRFFQNYDFKKYPGYKIHKPSWYHNCDRYACVWPGLTLESAAMEFKTIPYPKTPVFPYPPVMSSSQVPYSQGDLLSKRLLWDDLEGVATDAHLDDWMKGNFFKCE